MSEMPTAGEVCEGSELEEKEAVGSSDSGSDVEVVSVQVAGNTGEVEVDFGEIEDVTQPRGVGSETTETTENILGPLSIMATMEGSLGSQLIEPALDTGACVTMISRDRWRSAGCSKVIEGERMPQLHDASGGSLLVCGKTDVRLEMDGHAYRVPAYIVSELGVDMLLGADFCRATDARLDFGDMTVSLNGNRPLQLYSATKTAKP